MLTINPDHRISALDALQHTWFKMKIPKQEHELSKDLLRNLQDFRASMKL